MNHEPFVPLLEAPGTILHLPKYARTLYQYFDAPKPYSPSELLHTEREVLLDGVLALQALMPGILEHEMLKQHLLRNTAFGYTFADQILQSVAYPDVISEYEIHRNLIPEILSGSYAHPVIWNDESNDVRWYYMDFFIAQRLTEKSLARVEIRLSQHGVEQQFSLIGFRDMDAFRYWQMRVKHANQSVAVIPTARDGFTLRVRSDKGQTDAEYVFLGDMHTHEDDPIALWLSTQSYESSPQTGRRSRVLKQIRSLPGNAT